MARGNVWIVKIEKPRMEEKTKEKILSIKASN